MINYSNLIITVETSNTNYELGHQIKTVEKQDENYRHDKQNHIKPEDVPYKHWLVRLVHKRSEIFQENQEAPSRGFRRFRQLLDSLAVVRRKLLGRWRPRRRPSRASPSPCLKIATDLTQSFPAPDQQCGVKPELL